MTSSKDYPDAATPAEASIPAAHDDLITRFRADYSFPLDDYQLSAAAAIASGRDVLVAAPTGAGKTVVGEFAVFHALDSGGTCFYTTPIKALSNQKYHDLCERYGADRVGLLTGDYSINGDAPVVVMTTEVLRNMIYSDSHRLAGLSHVVLDEVHYLADTDRGPVWEETILNLDLSVRIISLSATVSNLEEFGGWLRTVRGNTDIITHRHRPVPLTNHMAIGWDIHPVFTKVKPTDVPTIDDLNNKLVIAIEKAEEKGLRGVDEPDVILEGLARRDLLPAIYFVFSRHGCDKAATALSRAKVSFTTARERRAIDAIITEGVSDIPEEDLSLLRFASWRRTLLHGYAAHHAGMIPAFRAIVEKLFIEGHLKVVFATETLALGVNMPARSVVLDTIDKFDGEGYSRLTPAQFAQLTGRAGRRGKDTHGHAIIPWRPGRSPWEVAELASTRDYSLISAFRPGYNMAVNLVARHGVEEAHAILNRSFAQYQRSADVVASAEERARTEDNRRRTLESLQEHIRNHDWQGTLWEEVTPADLADAVIAYEARRRNATRLQREAKVAHVERLEQEITTLLLSLRRGTVLALPHRQRPQLAVITSPARPGPNPSVVAIDEGGRILTIRPSTYRNVPVEVGHLSIPPSASRVPSRHRSRIKQQLRSSRFTPPRSLRPEARFHAPEVEKLFASLRDDPIHHLPEREEFLGIAAAVNKATRTLAFLDDRDAATFKDSLSGQLDRILTLLQERDYLDEGYAPTEEGATLAKIHHGSDLLVSQCLRRGIWDELDPAELAGAISSLVCTARNEANELLIAPTDNLHTALQKMMGIYAELASDEERHSLSLTAEPDLAFATAFHQWAAGAPLDYALGAASVGNGATVTPGDFIRWCRLVKDLLVQITIAGYSSRIRRNAQEAISAIDRGVVAIDAL